MKTPCIANFIGHWRNWGRSLGIGCHVVAGLDHVLLLYLERCQVDWQSRLFHRIVPIFLADHSVDSWHHIARCYWRHQILCHTKFHKVDWIWGKRWAWPKKTSLHKMTIPQIFRYGLTQLRKFSSRMVWDWVLWSRWAVTTNSRITFTSKNRFLSLIQKSSFCQFLQHTYHSFYVTKIKEMHWSSVRWIRVQVCSLASSYSRWLVLWRTSSNVLLPRSLHPVPA